MAIKQTQAGRVSPKRGGGGFALLIAVIFMTVMLTFGLALGSLSYKQISLASGALESQYAFYAADAGLECALYADQQNGGQPSLFTFPPLRPPSAPSFQCDGIISTFPSDVPTGIISYSAGVGWIVAERVSLDSGTLHPRCADITVYKYNAPQANGLMTIIYSQGYDVPCSIVAVPAGARIVSRGLQSSY